MQCWRTTGSRTLYMLGKLSTDWATSSILHLHILFLTFVVTQNILFYLTFTHSFIYSFIHSSLSATPSQALSFVLPCEGGPQSFHLLRPIDLQVVIAHAFNSSAQEAEAGGSLRSRPAWSTEQVPVQPGLCRETLTQNKTKQTNKKTFGSKSIPQSWSFGSRARSSP